MKTIARVLVYDVLLALIYIACDAYLIYFYLSEGHKWWAMATIAAVLLPGLIEWLVYTYAFLKGDLSGTKCQQMWEYLLWSVFSLFYPLALVLWHLIQVCKGENNLNRYETMARSRILNSLSVLTKSAAQMVLQTTIMMITWYQKTLQYHIYLPVSAAIAVMMLANSCTSHHYFESSGKSITIINFVPYSQRTRRLLFNILHILCRGFILALLASYLHAYILVVFALMILANFISALCIIDTKWSKHFMTSFAAILLPTCFVSREHIEDAGYGRRLFYRFYKVNALVFFTIAVSGLIAVNCFLHYTDMLEYNCSNLPFLSYNQSAACPEGSPLAGLSPPFDDILDPDHAWFHVIGSSIVLGLGIFHIILVFIEERCCIRDYKPVGPM